MGLASRRQIPISCSVAPKAPRAAQWDRRFAYEPAEGEKIPAKLLGFLETLEQPEALYRLSRYVIEEGRSKLRAWATLTVPADAEPQWIASHIAGAAVAMVGADSEATGRCQCQARWGSDEERRACEFRVERDQETTEEEQAEEEEAALVYAADPRDEVIHLLERHVETLQAQIGELQARQQLAEDRALKQATATIFELHEAHASQVWKLRERYEDIVTQERHRYEELLQGERERCGQLLAVERARCDEAIAAERMRCDGLLETQASRFDARVDKVTERADRLSEQQAEAGLKMYEMSVEAGKPNAALVSTTLGFLGAGMQMVQQAGTEAAKMRAAELDAKHQESMAELASEALETLKGLGEHFITAKFGAEGAKIAQTVKKLSDRKKEKATKASKQEEKKAKPTKSEAEKEKPMYGQQDEDDDKLDYTKFTSYPRLIAAINMVFDPTKITAGDWAKIEEATDAETVEMLRALKGQEPLDLDAFAEMFNRLRSARDPKALLESMSFMARAVITELGSAAASFDADCNRAMQGE